MDFQLKDEDQLKDLQKQRDDLRVFLKKDKIVKRLDDWNSLFVRCFYGYIISDKLNIG